MKRSNHPTTPINLRIITFVVLLLGLAMAVYWIMFLAQQIPIGEIPILSEATTALLAFFTGLGLICRKSWAIPCSLVLAGMWAYGVISGIGVVFQHGLNFTSPFGAFTDAILFPLILLFSIYMAVTVWRQRECFSA
jgi:hypothetical protein